MAQPAWVTESGSLGTIPESRFYRVALRAFDPDFPNDSSKVRFVKLSGDLPQGIQIDENGIIEGTPTATVQGIPALVSENVTSKFAVRSFTEAIVNGKIVPDRIHDRTFSLTVTGQDVPEFVTPAGLLGSFFDGEAVNIQIFFSDLDPDDTVTIDLASGSLPPGLTISSTGTISGHIAPAINSGSLISGWENEEYDSFPLQFSIGTISQTYQFTLRITDGTDSNLRTYSIFVGIITADATAFTVDTDLFTSDIISRAPFLETYTSHLGEFSHDNYFSYQFKGIDFSSEVLNYGVLTSDTSLFSADSIITADFASALPTGLVLDTETGFIHGILANVGLTEQTFNFTILVYKKDNPIVFSSFPFTMTIIGDINAGVAWSSDKDLGKINNGSISELFVRATASTGVELQYKVVPSIFNKLPQGLALLPSGNIVGRVLYQTFNLTDFKTTADDNNNVLVDTSIVTTDIQGSTAITFDNNTTTFDRTFIFKVEAFSTNGTVSTFKTFSITLVKKHDRPAHEIRLKALSPLADRAFIDTLLLDTTIIERELLYRRDDPYFGLATGVSYTHAYGLNPETLSSYAESLTYNHYNKDLTLGEIKTAVALNSDGTTRYEVVYSVIIDNLINNSNNSVGQRVNSTIGTVYPNSLDNMRDRVIDKVGQLSTDLPRWMVSKQANGNILGFTPAWIIAYTLPGQSSLVAYTINQKWEAISTSKHRKRLHRVNFSVDRYILGSQFTQNWDSVDQRWLTAEATSLDVLDHGISADKTNITVDTTHTYTSVTSVDASIITADGEEVSTDGLVTILLTVDNKTITTVDSNTITTDTISQPQRLLTVDLVNIDTVETLFDGGSCSFIGVRSKTVDMINETVDSIEITTDGGLINKNTTFTVTDKFDKYLLFPSVNIINKKRVVTDII
jgi:hypothetical protein